MFLLPFDELKVCGPVIPLIPCQGMLEFLTRATVGFAHDMMGTPWEQGACELGGFRHQARASTRDEGGS